MIPQGLPAGTWFCEVPKTYPAIGLSVVGYYPSPVNLEGIVDGARCWELSDWESLKLAYKGLAWFEKLRGRLPGP